MSGTRHAALPLALAPQREATAAPRRHPCRAAPAPTVRSGSAMRTRHVLASPVAAVLAALAAAAPASAQERHDPRTAGLAATFSSAAAASWASTRTRRGAPASARSRRPLGYEFEPSGLRPELGLVLGLRPGQRTSRSAPACASASPALPIAGPRSPSTPRTPATTRLRVALAPRRRRGGAPLHERPRALRRDRHRARRSRPRRASRCSSAAARPSASSRIVGDHQMRRPAARDRPRGRRSLYSPSRRTTLPPPPAAARTTATCRCRRRRPARARRRSSTPAARRPRRSRGAARRGASRATHRRGALRPRRARRPRRSTRTRRVGALALRDRDAASPAGSAGCSSTPTRENPGVLLYFGGAGGRPLDGGVRQGGAAPAADVHGRRERRSTSRRTARSRRPS